MRSQVEIPSSSFPVVPIRARVRLEAQGFLGLDDQTLAQINYWLRLSPAICMIWVAVGTALGSPPVLWSLVPFALLGALLPGHPFDLLYTLGFRRVVGGPRLPCYPRPRRLACLTASFWIAGEALAFQNAIPLAGHLLGWSLVVMAFVNVSMGFCVPSFIYGLLFGKPVSCAFQR